MARRKHSARPRDEVVDERDLELRYRMLGRLLMASEPESVAAELSQRIRAKVAQLNATGGPVAKRLATLERFLAELGLADLADRTLRRRQ